MKAMFQSYENTTPEADIVYGNMAGSDSNDKTINFLDYIGEKSPYSDYPTEKRYFPDLLRRKAKLCGHAVC